MALAPAVRASPNATRASCAGAAGSRSVAGARDKQGMSRPDLRRLRRPEEGRGEVPRALETEVWWASGNVFRAVRDIVEDLAKTESWGTRRNDDHGPAQREGSPRAHPRGNDVRLPSVAHRDEHRAVARDLVRGLGGIRRRRSRGVQRGVDTVDASHRAALRRLAQKETRETR